MHWDHFDPLERWWAASGFYAEWVFRHDQKHLYPMIGFTQWIGSQPFAADLYPCTSLDNLIIGPRTDTYHGGGIVVCILPDGQFQCKLHGRGTKILVKTIGPMTSARKIFASALIRMGLEG